MIWHKIQMDVRKKKSDFVYQNSTFTEKSLYHSKQKKSELHKISGKYILYDSEKKYE